MLKLSNRSDIESFRVLDNLRLANERAAQGQSIIRMEAGQPCFGAPQAALDEFVQCLADDPVQGYTDAIGTVRLRQRIVRYYKDTYNVDVDYSRIAITTGSSGAFILSFLSAFDVGDKVGLITPTYPAYRNILKAMGIVPVEIPSTLEMNYQATVEILDNCPEKLDGLIINSPSNPTGTMIDADVLKEVCAWCEDHKVRLVSDEAYHGVTYEKSAQTALKFTDHAIITNTFSKYFAMTGWRLGWAVLPENMTDAVKRMAENLTVSPPTISQNLAHIVFDHFDVLDGYVQKYKQNRDILMNGLPEAGIDNIAPAQGAFYLYADISNLTDDSEDFCRRMLDEAKVCATAGVDFDSVRGQTTMRMAYAASSEDMHEACRRLKLWLKG